MNLYARVKRGDVSQRSFGFDIISQEEIRENGTLSWHLTDVKLYEISVCTFPAYEETGVKAREKDIKELQEREAEALKQRLREKLQGGKTCLKQSF
jgi:phage head maturation protease